MRAWDRTTVRSTYELGGYREWVMPRELARVLEAAWAFRRPPVGTDAASTSRARGETVEPASAAALAPSGARSPLVGHRVLPHAGASLCFWSRRAPDGRCEEGKVKVIGPTRSARIFTPPPGLHIEAVRVKPEWMRSILGIDGAEHADVIGPATSVAGGASGFALRLRDRLLRTCGPGEALGLLIGCLGERIEGVRTERSTRIAHEVLERLRADRSGVGSGAPLGLSRIGGEVGVSERQLRRVVKRETGLGPKRLQRVDRMNRAVTAADRAGRPRWSRIALDHGYCDQAHLIRDVRAFSGRSPAELHEERRRQEIER